MEQIYVRHASTGNFLTVYREHFPGSNVHENMIHTSFPFGELIIYGALFFAFFAGLVIVTAGIIRRRSKGSRSRLVTIGAVMVSIPAFILTIDTIFHEATDLNPLIVADDITGEWCDLLVDLELDRDGIFRVTRRAASGWPAAGRWELTDWNLFLSDSAGLASKKLRVVRYFEELRIVEASHDGESVWSGSTWLARCDE